MLHPLSYKLNKTWTLNYYSVPLSLSPPSLPTSTLPTSLPSSPSLYIPLTASSSDPPSSVSASHYIYPVFLILSHSSLLVYTLLPPRFRPPLVFCTHSLILIKAHMDSVMAICTYLHERRSYLCHTKQLCNTCHASLTLSQFNTDNEIRQLVLDILILLMVWRLRQNAGVDNMQLRHIGELHVTCTWQVISINKWLKGATTNSMESLGSKCSSPR